MKKLEQIKKIIPIIENGRNEKLDSEEIATDIIIALNKKFVDAGKMGAKKRWGTTKQKEVSV